MPYTAGSPDLPANVKGLPAKERRQWAEIWNNTYSKCQADGGKNCEGKAFMAANGILKAKSSEAASKNPDDFLVVEDPEQVSTFHLQVMKDGKPDHTLMGAAHAALMSPNGYRGNKYEGSGKAAAIKKLKAMYKAEDMPWPAKEKASESEEIAETMYFVPNGVTTFADLQAAEQVYEATEEMHLRVDQFQQIVWNIFYSQDIPDKLGALRSLVDEFASLMSSSTGSVTGAELSEAATIKARAKGAIKALTALLEDKSIPDSLVKQIDGLKEALKKNWKDLEAEAEEEWGKGKNEEGAAPGSISLCESEAGSVLLVEADAGKPDLVTMNVRLIRPGWGNTKDNHFYAAEMLKANAKAFTGSKMYESDHRPAEKSTRTWVSTITEVNPDKDGNLIGKVVVHDPGFAQRVRNLEAAKLLEKMECSILADGSYRPNYEQDGRKGKYIESITKVDSVDWVTRAGAGGQALTIAESEEGMPGKQTETTQAPAAPVAPVPETPAAPVAENKPPVAPAAPVVPPAAPVVPAKLAETAVRAGLEKSRLPKASQERLAVAEYADEAALEKAIAAEIAYVKELTASGKPFLMGESAAPQPVKVSEADLQKRLDAVDQRHGIIRAEVRR